MDNKKHQKRLKLYKEGLNDRQIAQEVGVVTSTVWYWRNRRNLKPNGRLNDDDYSKMRKLHDKGFNDYQIAKETGFAQSTVWNWRQRHKLKGNK